MNIKNILYKNQEEEIDYERAVILLKEAKDQNASQVDVKMNLGGTKDIEGKRDIGDIILTLEHHFRQGIYGESNPTFSEWEGYRFISKRPYIISCEGTHVKYFKKGEVEHHIALEEQIWYGDYKSKGARHNWIKAKYSTAE